MTDLAEFERGKVLRGCGYTKTAPRKWTDSEIEYMKKLKEAGRSNAEIAAELGRSEVSISISIKLKRLTKKENTYNADHLGDKYDKNRKFLVADKYEWRCIGTNEKLPVMEINQIYRYKKG